jgi:hypothetical protein
MAEKGEPSLIVTAMSKIASFGMLSIVLPEKKTGHQAPYFKVLGPNKEATIRIDTSEIFKNSGFKESELKHIQEWSREYQDELLKSWDASFHGKALKVPTKMPKETSKIPTNLKLIDFRVSDDFILVLKFSNKEVRILDYKPYLRGLTHKDMKSLHKVETFKKAKVVDGMLEFSNGVQFEAGYLYNLSQKVDLKNL